MSRWIVDGMNVIGSRPNGWWRDRPGAMRALVEELEAFAARAGEPVTVVFDGSPFELESGSVDVMFASRRGPNAADDDIAVLVENDARGHRPLAGQRDDEPGGLSVVTSDGDLAGRVRAAGAAVVGAGEFRRRLDHG
jgi:predicted RNA-binding protein with PIN domain